MTFARTASLVSIATVLTLSSCGSSSSDDAVLDDVASNGSVGSTGAPTSDSLAGTTPTTMPPSGPPSAPSTAVESTTTEPAVSTTTSTGETADTSAPAPAAGEAPVIDIDGAALSTVNSRDPEAGAQMVADLATAFGEADLDSGWLPMPPKLACTGNVDFRNLQFGDLRIVLERTGPNAPSSFTGWSLGVASIPLAPGSLADPAVATGLTTVDGIGLGDPASELLATGADNLQRTDASTLVAIGARVITIETDENDDIVGFGSGRTDCIGGDIVGIPCDRPVPVYTLPDGTPTGEAAVDESSAFWAVEQIEEPSPNNTVTETFESDVTDFFELALDAPIRGTSGSTTLVAIPIGDPGVGGWAFVVLDDRTGCERLLRTPFPFEEDEAAAYAQRLAEGMNPQL